MLAKIVDAEPVKPVAIKLMHRLADADSESLGRVLLRHTAL
jgi:hypothetical protein